MRLARDAALAGGIPLKEGVGGKERGSIDATLSGTNRSKALERFYSGTRH